MSQEINRMAKRLQDLPNHIVEAVEVVINALSNVRLLDKEGGIEIELVISKNKIPTHRVISKN